MVGGHRWTFKARFRARAYGWRGSKTAIARLKEALSEIKAAAKAEAVAAGDGAVVLMERLWPTFQDIDTSSGALGTAVNATLEEIIPILIADPAMPKVVLPGWNGSITPSRRPYVTSIRSRNDGAKSPSSRNC